MSSYKNKLTLNNNSIFLDMTENLHDLNNIQKETEKLLKKYDTTNLIEVNKFLKEFLSKILKDKYKTLLDGNEPTILNNIEILKELLILIKSQKEFIFKTINELNSLMGDLNEIRIDTPNTDIQK